MAFIFTVCQVGAEAALKSEITTGYPELRFAYSRPGFLTFKSADGELQPDFELRSIFSRAYGLSIGKTTELKDVFGHARELQTRFGKKLRLHVFERDPFAPDEEPKGYVAGEHSHKALESLRAEPGFRELFAENPVAETGDPVLDLIWLDADQWWLGVHVHTPHHSPFPGGRPEITIPPNAPSRAYLKLEEALLWSQAPVRPGDVAVEIGSSPGGASFALIERGLDVVGIDPGEMADRVRTSSKFKHLMKPAAQVQRKELPGTVQWILLDMNVAPVVALNTVERIAPWYEESLLGVFLTLKLNEWKYAAEIPKLVRRVEKLGMSRIRTTQLVSNKQEICVVGFTRKGIARRGITRSTS